MWAVACWMRSLDSRIQSVSVALVPMDNGFLLTRLDRAGPPCAHRGNGDIGRRALPYQVAGQDGPRPPKTCATMDRHGQTRFEEAIDRDNGLLYLVDRGRSKVGDGHMRGRQVGFLEDASRKRLL